MSVAEASQPLRLLSPAVASPRPAYALVAVNLAGLIAVSLLLRVWQLGHVPGINGDEAWYGIQAVRLLNDEPMSWRTPTNNILNPFYFLPLAALHLFAAPSAELLRLPAVMSGVAALVLNFLLCRRAFGRKTAWFSTTLLAILPVNIAYSRFGWDTSQTLLFTLPAVYLPLLAMRETQHRQKWLLLAALTFVASLVVHPTNIFTAPLIVAPLVYTGRNELREKWSCLAATQRHFVWLAALPAGVLCGWLARPLLAGMLARLSSPPQWWEFAWHYERLFSGLTVYRFLSGATLPSVSQSDWLPLDLAWFAILLAAAVGIYARFRHDGFNAMDGCLVAGWALMLFGFFLVAGPGAIAPHFERYGLCLIAPAAVLITRGWLWWLGPRELHVARTAATAALGWLMLLGFQQHYFSFIHSTGGCSHETFRTAAAEPKQAALDLILAARSENVAVAIVTSEYWNEKPLTYLSAVHPQVQVVPWSEVRDAADRLPIGEGKQIWFVEFAGSPACLEVEAWLSMRGLAFRKITVDDYAGQPVLVLMQLTVADD